MANARLPLLFLDIDGVLNPLSNTPPPGFQAYFIDGYSVSLSDRHGRWLRELHETFEIVWASTWEHSANVAVGPLLGLPLLGVVEFGNDRVGDTWKLPAVSERAGDRPLVWIDDELYEDAQSWSRARDAPTLLVRPLASDGFTKSNFRSVVKFGERLGSPRSGDR